MKPALSALGAVVVLIFTFGAASIASRFPAGAWYATLNKPTWSPPNWLFGPVWSVLYLLMAIAAWLVWRRIDQTGAVLALGLYALQLVLNAAWSWIFFGRHQLGLALVELLMLLLAILATLIAFWRVEPISGYLLLPYLLWVAFASFLNLTLWRLNRGSL
ncbi:MAG: tryptophan-rich sensory protein [Anaerolineales bacterium]|jgi:tryptophan-rich sensory protein